MEVRIRQSYNQLVPKKMITALLLAAGESTRMKAFKQLLLYRGKSFVESCVTNLLGGGINDIVVVTGHRDAEVRAALSGYPVRFAHNPEFGAGMTSSIKKGLESVPDHARAVLITLADQPHIESWIIRAIVKEYEMTAASIIVPTSNGRRGHPILIDLKLRAELAAIPPEIGLRQVVHAHSADLLEVAVASGSVLKDFDYPDDYISLSDSI